MLIHKFSPTFVRICPLLETMPNFAASVPSRL